MILITVTNTINESPMFCNWVFGKNLTRSKPRSGRGGWWGALKEARTPNVAIVYPHKIQNKITQNSIFNSFFALLAYWNASSLTFSRNLTKSLIYCFIKCKRQRSKKIRFHSNLIDSQYSGMKGFQTWKSPHPTNFSSKSAFLKNSFQIPEKFFMSLPTFCQGKGKLESQYVGDVVLSSGFIDNVCKRQKKKKDFTILVFQFVLVLSQLQEFLFQITENALRIHFRFSSRFHIQRNRHIFLLIFHILAFGWRNNQASQHRLVLSSVGWTVKTLRRRNWIYICRIDPLVWAR